MAATIVLNAQLTTFLMYPKHFAINKCVYMIIVVLKVSLNLARLGSTTTARAYVSYYAALQIVKLV